MSRCARFGAPLTDHIGVMPYVQWQHMQDSSAPAGRCQYWKTASYAELSDATLDVLSAAVNDLPSQHSEVHVQHLGGAVGRVPAVDTAFSNRGAQFFVNLIGATPWAEDFGQLRERVRKLHEQIAPQALRTLLPNFSNQDDEVSAYSDPMHARAAGSTASQVRSDPDVHDPVRFSTVWVPANSCNRARVWLAASSSRIWRPTLRFSTKSAGRT